MNTDNCDLYVKHSYFLKEDKPEEYKDILPENHLETFSTMEIPIPVVCGYAETVPWLKPPR